MKIELVDTEMREMDSNNDPLRVQRNQTHSIVNVTNIDSKTIPVYGIRQYYEVHRPILGVPVHYLPAISMCRRLLCQWWMCANPRRLDRQQRRLNAPAIVVCCRLYLAVSYPPHCFHKYNSSMCPFADQLWTIDIAILCAGRARVFVSHNEFATNENKTAKNEWQENEQQFVYHKMSFMHVIKTKGFIMHWHSSYFCCLLKCAQ